MRNIFIFLLLSVFLTGCATTPYQRLGYEFIDRRGDLRLVKRDNDLYLEKFDGSESKRVTYAPDTCEHKVCFSKNGKFILYAHYITPFPSYPGHLV